MIQPIQCLTNVQVEAFQECFDFIRNGYRQIVAYSDGSDWYIKLRHEKNRSYMEIYIQSFTYQIKKNGIAVKSVSKMPKHERFKIEVNSDNQVVIKRICVDESQKQISDSDLTNQNEQ